MNKSKLKKITSARLFLPIVCLIAVLLLNVIRTPDFFNVSIRNGVLYGYIVDVINRASELVILAIGMTPVSYTHLSPESVEHLCAKCDAYAEHWAPKAEELFPVKNK